LGAEHPRQNHVSLPPHARTMVEIDHTGVILLCRVIAKRGSAVSKPV
jgi:hypothetical protein